jgi:hypothetical protein
MMQTQEA